MTDSPRRFSLPLWLSLAAVVIVALAPWWRNHSYLRDLYDYGLVLAANGHLDLGERPYVDFTTPIQAGFLGLNWLAERAGGGTYFGLTLGAAALIVLAGMTLPLMLARRWPWWAAAIVGGAVTVSAASQHTILWHNALGVIVLAIATWAVALAPVLRRADWPWHLLAGAALFLGGLNKLNYQLVSVAVCLAWILRAGLVRSAGWGRVLASAAGILVAGIVLPLAAELLWTGASLSLWFANVVTLPAGARTGIMREMLTTHFWVRPIHDYYGPLLLPQVGLVALWLAAWAVAGCWPAKTAARWDRWLAPAAAGMALAAGAALLATNFEIAPLGLGAWLALVVSVWLGFAPARAPARFALGLVLPALLLGATAWWSAWLGQRSQFGYSSARRADYVLAAQAGPAFAGLAGLRLPPEVVDSLRVLDQSLPGPDEDGTRPVFFGLGMEWAERYFPGPRQKGKPLWVHWGTSYDAAAIARLQQELGEEGRYRIVLTTVARDEWPDALRAELNELYAIDTVGPVVRRWTRRTGDTVNLADSFDILGKLGGNVDSHVFHFDRAPLEFKRAADGRMLLGTARLQGSMLLNTPIHDFRGVAVLERLPGSKGERVFADCKVIVHGAVPEDVRWQARVELPAGQQSVSVPFHVEAPGKRLLLWVTRPEGSPKGGFAGFREMEIIHAAESAGGAPQLRSGASPDVAGTPEMAASLFGPITWRPQQLVVRGGVAAPDGLEVAAGGEVWLHTDNMTGEIRGEVTGVVTPGARLPFVRVVWYKGGRLQILQNGGLQAGKPFAFHVWTAEPGGWIGFMLDPGKSAAPARVRINRSTLIP